MSGSEWRPARWTPGPLEERRLAAAALPRRGRLTQAAIARRLGVSRASVSRWAAAVRQRGRRGLRARPKTGRPPRLGARAWARLGRLLESGAVAAGFGTERWTLKRIATLIRREFGVRYHPRYLERPLKAHGFTVQRPATRAKERDEPAIAAWPRREWVAIKKAGPPCGAHAAVPRRDRPQLPAAAGHHLGSPRGDAAAAAPEPAARGPQHRRGHPRRPAVCAARPRQRLEPDGDPGPAALPAEGRRAAPRGPGPPQRAPRRTGAFLAAQPRDFAVAYLPAYAPELNPEEPCNACAKRAMANALPDSVADLHRLARREFRRPQQRPDLVVGCFRHAGLSVTPLR